MDLQDFQLYLPKYLSPEETRALFDELRQFPDNIDQRFYGFTGDPDIIYQGDGLNDLLIFNFADAKVRASRCLILSNTCDIALQNRRMFTSNLVYAPITSLEKYKATLLEEGHAENSIRDHLGAIRSQRITQIFYLPEGDIPESIVFFDKIYNCDNDLVDRSKLRDSRLFSLSQYGYYILLFKLSLHFTRLTESVSRTS